MIIGILLCIIYSKNYTKKNENPYENSSRRKEIIEDFEKNAQIDKADELLNDKNEGGYTGVYIENTKALLDFFTVDDVIYIEDTIVRSIDEINKFNDSNYFNENQDTLATLFNINSNEDFNKFKAKIPKENFKYCKLKEDSLVNKNDVITFKLLVFNDNEFTFNILITKNNDKINIDWSNS